MLESSSPRCSFLSWFRRPLGTKDKILLARPEDAEFLLRHAISDE